MPTYSIVMAFIDPDDSKIVKASLRRSQASGFTVISGRGTVRSPLLSMLGLDNPRRDLLLMVSEDKACVPVMENLRADTHMDRPGKGFTFSIPATRVYGLHNQDADGFLRLSNREPGQGPHYELLAVIVNNGMSERMIHAARGGGARGATVLHARGSGVHRIEKFFSLGIEPEKEVLIIVSEESQTESIIAALTEEVDFNTPNSGILFTFDIEQVTGLIQNVGE